MTYNVFSGTLNPTHSLTWRHSPNQIASDSAQVITVRLANQFKLVLVDNLGPGNGGATPSLVQQGIYFRGKCAIEHLPNSKSLTEALNINRFFQTSFKIPLIAEKLIILTSYHNISLEMQQ